MVTSLAWGYPSHAVTHFLIPALLSWGRVGIAGDPKGWLVDPLIDEVTWCVHFYSAPGCLPAQTDLC